MSSGLKVLTVMIPYDMWCWLDEQSESKADIVREALSRYRSEKEKESCAEEKAG